MSIDGAALATGLLSVTFFATKTGLDTLTVIDAVLGLTTAAAVALAVALAVVFLATKLVEFYFTFISWSS